jgi:glycosyltransferase involved in cell wall biosynthesis
VTRVFFWSADSGGCSWYRCHAPAAALTALGHDAHAAQRIPPWWADADIIVGQRVCMPGPSLRWQEWAADGRALVYDVDDDFTSVDPTDAEAYAFFTQPDVQRRMAENLAAATLVTCATERLAETYARFNPNVAIVPNALPGWVLDLPRPDHGDRVVVGWAGTPSTLPNLGLVVVHLRELLDRGTTVEVHAVGVDALAIRRAGLLNHPRLRVTPFVHGTPAYLRAIDFDVWVAPYRDIPFNRAKVPTKALEAAALGIPLVASAVGGYVSHVAHGATGYLVKRDHEWGNLLWRLVTDPQLRARMGRAARVQARAHTLDQTGPLWAKTLLGAAA